MNRYGIQIRNDLPKNDFVDRSSVTVDCLCRGKMNTEITLGNCCYTTLKASAESMRGSCFYYILHAAVFPYLYSAAGIIICRNALQIISQLPQLRISATNYCPK